MSKTEQNIRDSIVRRACEHVALRHIDEHDRHCIASNFVWKVREMTEMPNWRQVMQLVSIVREVNRVANLPIEQPV